MNFRNSSILAVYPTYSHVIRVLFPSLYVLFFKIIFCLCRYETYTDLRERNCYEIIKTKEISIQWNSTLLKPFQTFKPFNIHHFSSNHSQHILRRFGEKKIGQNGHFRQDTSYFPTVTIFSTQHQCRFLVLHNINFHLYLFQGAICWLDRECDHFSIQ